MEEAEKIDLSKRPVGEKNTDPSCPLWILGDEDSADHDMEQKFEVKED